MKRALAAALAALVLCAYAQPAAAQAAGTPASFDILEFEVEGNSLLSALQIERAVYPFLGPGGSIGHVEKARTALERAYHDAGFLTILVDIPEQHVREGVVRLRVTEGAVERLRVQGSRYYSQGAIRERLPALVEGSPPFFPELQQQLDSLNRGADRRVTPTLKQGSAPGTVQVDLSVEDKLPLHASAELNNRYSANTTRLRLSGMLRYDNLWQSDHSLTLNAQISPQDTDEVQVLSASYLLPLARSANLLSFYFVDSRSDVAAVGALGVIGRGQISGVRAIFPLAARGGYYHNLSLGMDYKDFDESVDLQGADSFNTPINYAAAFAQYGGTVQDKRGLTQFNAALNFGLRGLFGTTEQEFANKRFKAHANYGYLRADLQRTHTLPAQWSLVGRLDAQAANQALISNEQFVAGGYDSVRGYLEAEQLGDSGLRGSLELRTPGFDTGLQAIQQLNLIGFAEGAGLRVRDPLPSQTARFTLASFGIGARLRAWQRLSAALDLAWPLKTTSFTERGDTVLKFRLTYEY